MLNLILVLAVVLASVLPAKPRPPSCYIVKGAIVKVCRCEGISLPVWVCEKVNRRR